jgi:hypothetical protein
VGGLSGGGEGGRVGGKQQMVGCVRYLRWPGVRWGDDLGAVVVGRGWLG